MQNECDKLNEAFFFFITRRRPFIILKYAMTADGKTAAVVRETFSPQGETESETETVFHYHAGGDLESEDFFSDGVLQKRIRYLGENRRIETVFDGGRELFSQEYADGVPVQNAPDGQRGG